MPVVGCDAQSFTALQLLHKGIVALAIHLKDKWNVPAVSTPVETAAGGSKLNVAILPSQERPCS